MNGRIRFLIHGVPYLVKIVRGVPGLVNYLHNGFFFNIKITKVNF